MKIKTFLKKLLLPVLNERGGGGGGGNTTQRTEYPEQTPEQLEANKMAFELGEEQIQETRRRNELTQELAPYQSKLLGSQLDLSNKARGALQQSLTPDQFADQRSQLRDALAKKTLAKLRGEDQGVTPQQKEKLGRLEDEYVSSGQSDLKGLQAALQGKTGQMSMAEGLRPGGNATAFSSEAIQSELGKTERGGRALNLQQQLDLPLQNMQSVESQRQFSESYGASETGQKYGALMNLAGISGGGGQSGGSLPQASSVFPTNNMTNLINQMQQARQAQGVQSSQGPGPNQTAQGVQGAISGAGLGASVAGGYALATGATLAPMTFGLSLAIPAVAGAIYGFSS